MLLNGPVDTNVARWPSTAATAWTTIAACFIEWQNARISWTIAIYAPAGVTGQFRLLCDGNPLGDLVTVADNATTYWSQEAIWPQPIGTTVDPYLQLQAQVSAGVGAIAAQCFRLKGAQT